MTLGKLFGRRPRYELGKPTYSSGSGLLQDVIPDHVAKVLPYCKLETMSLGGVDGVIVAIDDHERIVTHLAPNWVTSYNQRSIASAVQLYNKNIDNK